jgi:hypothetical protein
VVLLQLPEDHLRPADVQLGEPRRERQVAGMWEDGGAGPVRGADHAVHVADRDERLPAEAFRASMGVQTGHVEPVDLRQRVRLAAGLQVLIAPAEQLAVEDLRLLQVTRPQLDPTERPRRIAIDRRHQTATGSRYSPKTPRRIPHISPSVA